MPAPTTSKSSESSSNNGGGTTQELETWFEKVVDGKDGVPRQIFLGGVSGWVTGFLAMKVGKVAATAIGGGILLIQFANHKGYININWNRVNKDVSKIQKQIQKEAGGKKDWADKLENKLNKAADKAEQLVNRGERQGRKWYHKFAYGEDLEAKELQVFATAFAAGVAIGLLTGKGLSLVTC